MEQTTKEGPMTLMDIIREDTLEQRREWSHALRAAKEMVRRTIEDDEKIDVLYLRGNFREEHPEVQPKYVTLAIEYALKSLNQR